MKVRWTRAAQQQLREIVSYIAVDSPIAAATVASRIRALVEKIAAQPLAGRMVPEVGSMTIRERRAAPYRVIYLVGASDAKILAVRHERRLLALEDVETPAAE